jgi:hypothetical protein
MNPAPPVIKIVLLKTSSQLLNLGRVHFPNRFASRRELTLRRKTNNRCHGLFRIDGTLFHSLVKTTTEYWRELFSGNEQQRCQVNRVALRENTRRRRESISILPSLLLCARGVRTGTKWEDYATSAATRVVCSKRARFSCIRCSFRSQPATLRCAVKNCVRFASEINCLSLRSSKRVRSMPY